MDRRVARRCGLYGGAAIIIGAMLGSAGWAPFERLARTESTPSVGTPFTRCCLCFAPAKREARRVPAHHVQTPDEAAIGRVIESHRDELGVCYTVGLNRLANDDDRLTLRLNVTAEGTVSKAAVADSNAHSTEVDSCAGRTARHWRFTPSTDGASLTVTYPVSFKKVPFNFTAATR